MVTYGKRTYGRVDEIEGTGAVETLFFHIWWIPLVPVESLFCLDGPEGTERADRQVRSIPLSTKSVATAWTRLFFGFVAVFAILPGFGMLSEGTEEPGVALVSIGVGLVALAAFFVVGRWARRCTPQRRAELLGEGET